MINTPHNMNKVYSLSKHLDDKIALIQLENIVFAHETLCKDQADNIGVAVERPFMLEHYSY